MMMTRLPGALLIALALAVPALCAPTLQRMAQPGSTELIIYTGSSQAVVRQQCMLRLHEGANTVGFEWESDSVDAASIRLHSEDAGLEIGEVSRPPGGEHVLHWTVTAPRTDRYALTTSFLLGGLKWRADYRLSRAPRRPAGLLRGWLTVTNESGLELENLRTSLVLGRPGGSFEGVEQAVFPVPELSELAKGTSVRAAFLSPTELPVWTIHRIDTEAAPERVSRLLQIQPPSDGPLARVALPSGPMTVIYPHGTLQATLSYEPSEAFEVPLGHEPDLVVERRLVERKKTDLQFDRLGQVSGFDTTERYEVTVRSHLDELIEVELHETVLQTWEIRTSALYVLESGKAILRLSVPARGQSAVEFMLVKHSGTRIP